MAFPQISALRVLRPGTWVITPVELSLCFYSCEYFFPFPPQQWCLTSAKRTQSWFENKIKNNRGTILRSCCRCISQHTAGYVEMTLFAEVIPVKAFCMLFCRSRGSCCTPWSHLNAVPDWEILSPLEHSYALGQLSFQGSMQLTWKSFKSAARHVPPRVTHRSIEDDTWAKVYCTVYCISEGLQRLHADHRLQGSSVHFTCFSKLEEKVPFGPKSLLWKESVDLLMRRFHQ